MKSSEKSAAPPKLSVAAKIRDAQWQSDLVGYCSSPHSRVVPMDTCIRSQFFPIVSCCEVYGVRLKEKIWQLMAGFQSLLPEVLQNGGTRLSTMLLPWLELES
ncbi:Hypothetical predicted protein [Olea europaea subsp. europaea]|uniref:Uncharacterized protein n=1 Tax=Olea europaea subsp. europaea TaxID=158383 RepID=A0A8S0SFC9_OLEEU|nr:Hypothetical predicted protein [Olea europaea subsp. europaea]